LADCTGGIDNCIIWANWAVSGAQLSSSSVPQYSCVEDAAFAGNGNLYADPRLADVGTWRDPGTPGDKNDDSWRAGDPHLMSGSPCIDAGENTAVPLDSVDLDADGDAGERLPWDLAAAPRCRDDPATVDTGTGTSPVVDMGAYEYRRLAPVYRFWSDTFHGHFYTVSTEERDTVIAQWSNNWSYEGVAYYAYAPGQQPAGTLPVYRFWSPTFRHHFYTISSAERDNVMARWSQDWTYEGDAWHTYEQ
jgi:hypothetical protein